MKRVSSMQKTERNGKIYEMRKDRKTFREIAEAFDISPARVVQIYKSTEKDRFKC